MANIFTDDIFQCIYLKRNVINVILMKFNWSFVYIGPIHN